jgi:hypothetical protein
MKRTLILALCLAFVAALVFHIAESAAYERYNDGCQTCHGAFTGGSSPKGSVIPSNDKHHMHRSSSYMNTECDLCHTSGDGRDPFIGSSDGTAASPGLGCTGCHEKYGLRAHHATNAVTSCAVCHSGDPLSPPEGTNPAYYGTVDTNADSSCNLVTAANANENWTIGDFIGLDNDGDDLYDGDDQNCQTVPDVKANGSDGPLNIAAGESLVVTVSLDAGPLAGDNVDWWVVAQSPTLGIFHYTLGGMWVPGLAPTFQGALFDLAPFEVLNSAALPAAMYTIHFGVDLNMNGVLDFGHVFSDSVDVTVSP